MSSSSSSDRPERQLSPWELEFLRECRADHTGIWDAVAIAREFDETLDRARILTVIEDLLGRELIVAGLPAADWQGFDPWPGTPRFIRARIDREWRALGRDPQLGDIVWFTTTSKGDQLVGEGR